MELWVIWNKAILLSYVILTLYRADQGTQPSYTLAFLCYLCLNVAIPIFKQRLPRCLLAIGSAIFVIGCAIKMDPLYLLLLPPSLYELIHDFKGKEFYAFVVIFASILVLPSSVQLIYGLAALLTYALLALGTRLTLKLREEEEERERLRGEIRQLSRSLNDNKEYIRQSEYTIKLEERNRLSQQIHDEIGHAMAGALIQMEASRRLFDSNRDKASELLGNAIQISKEGLEQIRLTLKNAKPPTEQMGINRLQLFVDELSAKQGLQATLNYQGNMDLITPIQWQIIHANATEAATNALKYASASSVHVEVNVLRTFVKAVISDNGRGADKVVKGLGILGMEERAASIGGTVIVDGSNGFSVTMLLPCDSRR